MTEGPNESRLREANAWQNADPRLKDEILRVATAYLKNPTIPIKAAPDTETPNNDLSRMKDGVVDGLADKARKRMLEGTPKQDQAELIAALLEEIPHATSEIAFFWNLDPAELQKETLGKVLGKLGIKIQE